MFDASNNIIVALGTIFVGFSLFLVYDLRIPAVLTNIQFCFSQEGRSQVLLVYIHVKFLL